MGIDRDFASAFAKSQLGAGVKLPDRGDVFISVKNRDKEALIPIARKLVDLGFTIIATEGTARSFQAVGLAATRINKVLEGQPHIVDAMINGQVQLVINTSEGAQATADSFSLRRTELTNSIPYYTTVAGARAAVEGIAALKRGGLEVAPLQSYLGGSF